MKMLVLFTMISVFAVISCTDNTEKKESITVDLLSINGEEMGESIGTVTIRPRSDGGTEFIVEVTDVIPGKHGFHVHTNPSLAGLSAGGHWDPADTRTHQGPYGDGHRGDLPFLTANENGNIEQTVFSTRFNFEDIKNRSVILHENPDNYTDNPVNGGSGARIAGAIIIE